MITIRRGHQKDIHIISEILIDTWQKSYKSFIPQEFLKNLNLEQQMSRHKIYMDGGTSYFVAENDKNEAVGFASFGKNRIQKVKSEIELYTIYVSCNHHGKGIGTKLLSRIYNELNNNIDSIVVSVFEENPYKDFYIKNGFEKIDEEVVDLGVLQLEGGIYRKWIS